MKLVSFNELPLEKLRGQLLLIDYEGTLTLPGTTALDDETLSKVCMLISSGNKVAVVTNHSAIDDRLVSAGVKFIHLAKPKPHISEELKSLVSESGLPATVIGDSSDRDGGVARALGVPFMLVRSHGTSIEERSESPVPSIFYDETRPIVSLFVPPYFKFWPLLPFKRFMAGNEQVYILDLIKGLRELCVKVHLNPPQDKQEGLGVLLSQTDSVNDLIASKQKGFLAGVIIGPGSLLKNGKIREGVMRSDVDAIVVERDSLRAALSNRDQYFNRVAVIPRGVADPGERPESSRRSGLVIIYSKNAPERLFNTVMKSLWQRKYKLLVLKEKNLNKSGLAKKFKDAELTILFDENAMEAHLRAVSWLRGVPTLEWRHVPPAECGVSFSGEDDFERCLDELLRSTSRLRPRNYALGYATHAAMARSYLNLFKRA